MLIGIIKKVHQFLRCIEEYIENTDELRTYYVRINVAEWHWTGLLLERVSTLINGRTTNPFVVNVTLP